MKRFLLYLILLSVATQLMAGRLISGIVVDGHREPIVGANVFVYGTVDGCATDSLGRFGFRTDRDGTVIVMVTFLGYEDKKISVTAERSTGLRIILYEKTATIDEVVVSASSYNFGTGDNVGKLGEPGVYQWYARAESVCDERRQLAGPRPILSFPL